MERGRRRAFTLIEMLVVVSLVTMLIAMLLPALGSARAAALTAKCASNQRQLMIAVGGYVDDTMYYPVGIDHHDNNNLRVWLWPPQLRRYTGGNTEVMACPAAPVPTVWQPAYGSGLPPFYGYENDEVRILGMTHTFSYGYNVWGGWMMQNPNTGLGVYRGHSFLDATLATRVLVPGDMIGFADSELTDYWSGYIGPYRVGQFPSTIHRGYANVAYCDNHVELKAPPQLIDMSNDVVNRQWNNDHQVH